jgi:ABC-type dipeptide/oligopeptide/nickel transport system ATPase component
LLRVHNLHMSFQGREVVHGVSFEMQAGEKLALVGESGSGKTVTALSLLGLARGAWVRGEAMFNGQDLYKMAENDWRGIRGSEIAMVFQEPMTALNPTMRCGEQVAEAILRVVRAARPGPDADDFVNRNVAWGPSPRASQALMLGARARAMLQGRLSPSLDDVQALMAPVFRHRMALNFTARADGHTIEGAIERLSGLIA